MQLFNAPNSTLGTRVIGNWNAPDAIKSVLPGVGVSTFNGQVRAQALDPSQAATNNRANSSSSSFTQIEKFAQLQQSLDLAVEANASYLAFSASDKLNYSQQSGFNSYDFFVLACMKVRLPSKIMNGGEFLPQAQADAKSLSQADFYAKYGDGYVSLLEYGGDLFGLLRVQCQTRNAKESLRNSFSGSAPGVDLTAQISTAYSTMSNFGMVQTLFMKTGAMAPSFVDRNNFVEQLRGFGAEVLASGGEPVGFAVTDYAVANWPDRARRRADFAPARNALRQASALASTCEGLLKDARHVIGNPGLFTFADVSLVTVQQEVGLLEAVAAKTAARIEAISQNPLAPIAVNPVEDLSGIHLPVAISLVTPNVSSWVGVAGIAVSNGDSNTWAGFADGHLLDSFAVRPTDAMDIHFSYTGRFSVISLIGLTRFVESFTNSSSGDGTKVEGGRLSGVSVSIGGRDAHFFDVCYQLHLADGSATGVATNGEWVYAKAFPNLVDGVRVFLRPK